MVVTSVLLAACGGPDPTASSATPPDSAAPTRTAAASPSASAPASSATSAASSSPGPPPIADEPPPLALEAVASGLVAPIGIATGPAGWLLVQEQAGRIVALDLESGETSMTLDLADRVLAGGERGLLGLALHPGWPDDPRAFVHYSDRDGNTVLAEFRAADGGTAGAPVLDPASERVLLTAVQPFANHNGGQLAFGADGQLWLGLGDGGSRGDPLGNGQNPFALLGKILRLDVDAEPQGDRAYAIPQDNPFADGAEGAPEAYLIGLRNPWRFSFDRATGELWIADVGQNAFEEVNRWWTRRRRPARISAGTSWRPRAASRSPGARPTGWCLPVAEYGRDLGCSVTGGYVYRGIGRRRARRLVPVRRLLQRPALRRPLRPRATRRRDAVPPVRMSCSTAGRASRASARTPTASCTWPTTDRARSTASSPAPDRPRRWRAGWSIDRVRSRRGRAARCRAVARPGPARP